MFRVGANKLQDADKGMIIGFYEAGWSVRKIAAQTGFHRNTVQRWIQRYRETGGCKRKEGTGFNKLKTTAGDDVSLALTTLDNTFATIEEIQNRTGLGHLHRTTVSRKIRALTGFNSRYARVKQALTDVNQSARLHYAILNRDVTVEQWGKIIFSDEKMVGSADHGPIRVWRLPGSAEEKENVMEINKTGRVSVNVWVCMTGAGLGQLVLIDGNLNSLKYIEIIRDHMLPWAWQEFIGENIVFMQDHATPHTSLATREFLTAQDGLVLHNWINKGCDLNPIENIWSLLCKNLQDVGAHLCTTKDELWEITQTTWEEMRENRVEFVQRLVEGRPQRMVKVIENEGYWIKH